MSTIVSFLTGDLLTTLLAILAAVGGYLGWRYKVGKDAVAKDRQKHEEKVNEIQEDMGVARDAARRDGAAKRLRDGSF